MMPLPFLADAFRRNPYGVYSVLRRVSPVIRLRKGIWALFSHDDVRRALVDHEAYSSRAAVPGGTPLDWMIFQDPPRHTALRALVTRTFAPRAVANLETRISAIANGLLDDVASRGEMDLVTEFAERLPLLVISEMLGVPHTDAPRMTRWGDAIIHVGDALYGGERAVRAGTGYRAAKEEIRPYLTALLADRRVQPRNDLLTRLVSADVDGARLTDEEIVSFFELLLLAGTETTTNLIANTMLCFFDHPAEYARVRQDLALLPAAMEEVLRFRSPVQMVFRVASRNLTVGGRTILGGDLVLVMIGSANRDPLHFPRAGQFDITRTGVSHVGFGHGAHYCVGAALGRLEGRVAVAALLERLPDLHRADRGAWAPRTGINVHGPRSLPVRFNPAPERCHSAESIDIPASPRRTITSLPSARRSD